MNKQNWLVTKVDTETPKKVRAYKKNQGIKYTGDAVTELINKGIKHHERYNKK